MSDSSSKVNSGVHGVYYWLTSTEDFMGTFLNACPDVIRGRYIAVLMTDGGTLDLTGENLRQGWQASESGIAYSPRISSVDDYPVYQIDGPDGPGYDEWYILTEARDIGERARGNIFQEAAPAPGRVACFASYAAFVLDDMTQPIRDLVDLFWPQLERIHPESYLSDGFDRLTFISRNRELFDSVLTVISDPNRLEKLVRVEDAEQH